MYLKITEKKVMPEMLTTINGLILRERTAGESCRFVDVLTDEMGVIEVSVTGSRKVSGQNISAVQLFAYSKLCIRRGRGDIYYLNSSEPICIFYDLRTDLKKLALASYMSELILYAVPGETDSGILRIFLNTLYFTAKDIIPAQLVKSIFELRLLSELGYAPDIERCRGCSAQESGAMYFMLDQGYAVCMRCYNANCIRNGILLEKPVLSAMRYILSADLDRLFSFNLGGKSQSKLSFITQQYVLIRLEKNFKTLDFYNRLEEYEFSL